jgi:hypothetical protein
MKTKLMNNPTFLLDFRHNVYSQTGEDGILQKIFEILPKKDRWCVEFGAWDGKQVSNTMNLIKNKDYSAILIEASSKRFKDLQKNYSDNSKVITVNKFVGFDEENCLDKILVDYPIPKDFDFLSIDIDGNDYHTWKAMSKYKPKVVCIEFNPTIPNEIHFIQQPNKLVNQGSSLLSLVELANKKGYELVSCLRFNAIFVREEYFSYFHIKDNRLEILRTNLDSVTYFFTGYDGKVFLYGSKKLQGHYDFELNEFFFNPYQNYFVNFLRLIIKLKKYGFIPILLFITY